MHLKVRTVAIISVVLLMALLPFCAFSASDENPPNKSVASANGTQFKQDIFAIGLWVDPPMDAKAHERYRELSEANFTMVISGKDLKSAKEQIKLCEEFGMRVLVNCSGVAVKDLPDGPSVWGYSLADEPAVPRFGELLRQASEIRAMHPGKICYINLLPNYASPGQLGCAFYGEYVKRFCETLRPEVLSMDHYPIFKPGKNGEAGTDGRGGYIENLETMRVYSLKQGIPFWNFFNSMPYGPHTDPTEDQLRWQIYSSLTYGAKGLMYFCYSTPVSPEFPKGGAIIRRDDTRTRHYDQARRLNAELKALGPTLMQLTNTGVIRIKPGDDPALVLKGSPIRTLKRDESVDPDFDYIVGTFQHADGRRAVMLFNYQFAYTAWPTVEFDADPAGVVEVDKATGKERPVLDESPEMKGLQVSLDAGEGRLFLIGIKK